MLLRENNFPRIKKEEKESDPTDISIPISKPRKIYMPDQECESYRKIRKEIYVL